MGLFKPYDQETTDREVQSREGKSARGENSKSNAKKSAPTPTRKQAEAARRDRLQPVMTRKDVKAQERKDRYRARDEQMAKTNALPYNEMIRDWVDHRWNMAEFALPILLLLFVGTLIMSYAYTQMAAFFPFVIWGFFGVLVLDTAWMWIGCRNQLRNHFPYEPMKGKFSYAMSRTMLMRRSRIPQPRVKRGTKFVWPYQGSS
ncbi:MAG: DUF3043 domain-containing protein [Propionibacteriaceae bacterium]|nr:DUF3043 domain-containing protein [Propionibacteriaceae bacterium]